MSECGFRRGFFLPHPCGNPATQLCSSCATPICALHQRFDGTGCRCPDCAEPVDDAARSESEEPVEEEVDELIRERKTFRRDASNTDPTSNTFTNDDHAAFDSDNDFSDFSDDDSAPIDFGDS